MDRKGFREKNYLPQKSTRTLVLVGGSGNGKSATGNSILREKVFQSEVGAAAVTKECELKTAKRPNGQIINVIDTPGLNSLFPSNDSTIREILKCSHLAREGIHAMLMVFSLRNRLTKDLNSVLFTLKNLFGNNIVDYMIVVFTNEDALDDADVTIEDYLKGSPDFKEILTACKNRMVVFDNRPKTSERKKTKQVQELLDLVEEVVKGNNKKPFMVNLSCDTSGNEALYEEAEQSPQDQLCQMVQKVDIKLDVTASMLKQQLDEEKNARLEAEKRAKNLQEESSEEIKKLDRAEKELEKKEKNASFFDYL